MCISGDLCDVKLRWLIHSPTCRVLPPNTSHDDCPPLGRYRLNLALSQHPASSLSSLLCDHLGGALLGLYHDPSNLHLACSSLSRSCCLLDPSSRPSLRCSCVHLRHANLSKNLAILNTSPGFGLYRPMARPTWATERPHEMKEA